MSGHSSEHPTWLILRESKASPELTYLYITHMRAETAAQAVCAAAKTDIDDGETGRYIAARVDAAEEFDVEVRKETTATVVRRARV